MASTRFAESVELDFLFNPGWLSRRPTRNLLARIELLTAVQKTLALTSPYANYVAALLEGLDQSNGADRSRRSFMLQLSVLLGGDGPYSDLNRNIMEIYGRGRFPTRGRIGRRAELGGSSGSDIHAGSLVQVFDAIVTGQPPSTIDPSEQRGSYQLMLRRARTRTRSLGRKLGIDINLKLFDKSMDRPFAAALNALTRDSDGGSTPSMLRMFLSASVLQGPLLDLVCDVD